MPLNNSAELFSANVLVPSQRLFERNPLIRCYFDEEQRSLFATGKEPESSPVPEQVLRLRQGLQRTTVLKTFLQLASFGTLRTAVYRADALLPLWLSEYAAGSFRATARQSLFVFATSARRAKR